MPDKILEIPTVNEPETVHDVFGQHQFKLNIYASNGNVRSSIPTAIYVDMCAKHGDIIHAMSSVKWMNIDEICDSTWRIEKRLRHPSNRSRKSIETALSDLLDRDLVLKKK